MKSLPYNDKEEMDHYIYGSRLYEVKNRSEKQVIIQLYKSTYQIPSFGLEHPENQGP